ncbi:hypothetical protein GGR54DRAFT_578662 [Hypoxylon sp. NC1633]|nr:hypothetical protein GGR54DRAFT_578662 [Hypoxylon sp. NC1633]
MDTSPSKRRVLGSIDSNSRASASFPKLEASKSPLSPVACGSVKRPRDLIQESVVHPHQQRPLGQPTKRQRVSACTDSGFVAIDQECGTEGDSCGRADDNGNANLGDSDVEYQRSGSPDDSSSSIFDTSVVDTSLATTTTEPDVEMVAATPPVAHRQPRAMTREEARQRAETLRLRLGLASYKVRTGQTDVPLQQLKVKPLPGGYRRETREQLPLPPFRRAGSAREDVGNEDRARSRPAAAARRALPTGPKFRRGDSAGDLQASADGHRQVGVEQGGAAKRFPSLSQT